MAKKAKQEDETTASVDAVVFSQSTDVVIVKVIADFGTLKAGDEVEVSQNIAEILSHKKLVEIK